MSEHSLKKLSEFQRVLKNYRPKVETAELLNKTTLALLIAPAAAGRNTMIRSLLLTGKYHFIVSDTTRPPRVNNGVAEVNGREYWFCNEEYFLEGLKRGDYFAPAIIHNQQVSGINWVELQKAYESHKIAITDIDLQGSDNLQLYAPNAHNVFILPPDFNEWMRRLDGRGPIDQEERKHRLESAVSEIEGALERDYLTFVINWDLRTTSQQIHEFLTGVRAHNDREAACSHAAQLLEALRAELA